MAASPKVLAQGSAKPALAAGVLRIYGMRFCPYVRRVLLVLASKGISYEIVNIHLKQKPDWYLALNSEGKVPLLQQDDKLLNESLIIADYLDEKYPGPKLWSSDPYEKARGRMVIELLGKLTTQFPKLYLDKSIAAFDKVLEEAMIFEKLLKDGKTTFFSGSKPGMVDYMAWPMFDTLLGLWEVGLYHGKPLLCNQERPNVSAWVENMRKDPVAVQCALPADMDMGYKKSLLEGKPDFDFGL